MKYTYNLAIVVDAVALLSIHKKAWEDWTCGFHYTIQKYKRVYSTHPRSQFILNKLLLKISSSVTKHQSHYHPNQPLLAIYQKYCHLLCSQWITHPCINYQHLDNSAIWWDVHYCSSKWNKIWSKVKSFILIPLYPDSQLTSMYRIPKSRMT